MSTPYPKAGFPESPRHRLWGVYPALVTDVQIRARGGEWRSSSRGWARGTPGGPARGRV